MFAIDLVCVLTTFLHPLCAPYVDSSKILACRINYVARLGFINLRKQHSTGVVDNASTYDNIEDVCNGKNASRSKYTCNECQDPGAPGGYTELSLKLLKYIITGRDLVEVLHLYEIAGGCHSCDSKHYEGKAVDIHTSSEVEANILIELCNDWGELGINETGHIHCQFP